MKINPRVAVLAMAIVLPGVAEPQATLAVDDRARWVGLKDSGFAVPHGTRAVDLLVEMNSLLASPDPLLRDEVAYSAAERWLVRDPQLTPDEFRRVRDLWFTNLHGGVGRRGDDRVFSRSYSALCLSLVAAADLRTPFLSDAEYTRFVDEIVNYLDRERDVRGFDATRGWIHTVAHTADALKFLARNPKLQAEDAERILAAVSRKLRSVDEVWQWGEADRLAQALVAIARKYPDLVARWEEPWPADARQLWVNGPNVDPRQFAHVENVKQTLRSTYVALALASATGADARAETAASAEAVLKILGLMR